MLMCYKRLYGMASSLLLVCDDAGYESVDRGIRMFVEKTQMPVCAEYLIERDGAADRARAMAREPLVSVGLHFELSGISDADRVRMARELIAAGSSLGEQEEIQRKAINDARRQLALFQDTLGVHPAHISTHGNFNVSVTGQVLPWWHELMSELFGEHVPPMQLSFPHVRHNLYSWCCPGTARPPCLPEEFGERLSTFRGNDLVEFVMHPALPEPGDASLEMLFTAEMRSHDLAAAMRIIESGVIERTGFRVTPVTALIGLIR